jgi:hypothetical protein
MADCSGACTVGILAQPFARPPLLFCFHTNGPQLHARGRLACKHTCLRKRIEPVVSPASRVGPASRSSCFDLRMSGGSSSCLAAPRHSATSYTRFCACDRLVPWRSFSFRSCRVIFATSASAHDFPAHRRLAHLAIARRCHAQLLLLLLLPVPCLLRPCHVAGPSAAILTKLPLCAASLPSVRVCPEPPRFSSIRACPNRARPWPASRPACIACARSLPAAHACMLQRRLRCSLQRLLPRAAPPAPR